MTAILKLRNSQRWQTIRLFLKILLRRQQVSPESIIWQTDKGLRECINKTREVGLETLLDVSRLSALRAALSETLPLEGEVIEFGSYRGGSAGLIALTMMESGKILHLCDSFQGLPEPSTADNYHKSGDFSDTNLDKIKLGFKKLGCLNFTRFNVGFFSDTIPQIEPCQFCFAHIDVDLYESIKECLEFVYPRMTPGGIIIFDDYGAPTCLGAKLAVDEFFAERMETPECISAPAWGVKIGCKNITLRQQVLRRAGWINLLFNKKLYPLVDYGAAGSPLS